jgi:AmmeMemoRadiSam system protein A
MSIYPKLARFAIKEFLQKGKISPIPFHLPAKMLNNRAGVFVSLHKKDGSLRGCIGTFLPTRKNIAEEVMASAISAAFQDPRFPPVEEQELADLEISVDVLSELKLVSQNFKLGGSLPPNLNPKEHGLMVTANDGRRGLLLPNIPGVKTTADQIEICEKKAGIGPNEEIKLQIFKVKRHCE